MQGEFEDFMKAMDDIFAQIEEPIACFTRARYLEGLEIAEICEGTICEVHFYKDRIALFPHDRLGEYDISLEKELQDHNDVSSYLEEDEAGNQWIKVPYQDQDEENHILSFHIES